MAPTEHQESAVPMLQDAFVQTLQCFKDSAAAALWEDIKEYYTEPQRYYHNLHHLDTLLQALQGVKSSLRAWDAIVLAIAYHDIIYDVSRHDNEERSAAHAAQQLGSIVPAEVLQHCTALILATKSHEESSDSDIAYFTDADLSILGAPPEVYRRYCAAIRAEYSIYPDALYIPGRRNVLHHFLQMQQIFKTQEFVQQYEQAARANLAADLKDLGI